MVSLAVEKQNKYHNNTQYQGYNKVKGVNSIENELHYGLKQHKDTQKYQLLTV